MFVPQKLDVSSNQLICLPGELSKLRNLRELLANNNELSQCPVSILSSLTALTTVDVSHQHGPRTFDASLVFDVPSLLPMLHPGLVKLDLRQHLEEWTPDSLHHLACAEAAVGAMRPPPTLLYVVKSIDPDLNPTSSMMPWEVGYKYSLPF